MPAPKGHEPYPGCETGGRPTKYTVEFIEAEADQLEEWMKRKDSVWFEDFAFERGYHTNRLKEFASENEKFSWTYQRCQDRQKSLLIKGGLLKKFNYNMCQLLLGHSYGIVAKQETKVSGDSALTLLLQEIDGRSKDLIHNDRTE
jgi:hypothetical protein